MNRQKLLNCLAEVKGLLSGLLSHHPDDGEVHRLRYDVDDMIHKINEEASGPDSSASQPTASQPTANWDYPLLDYRDEKTSLTLLDVWLSKLLSIKRYRALTGLGLREAKDAVDALQTKWETKLKATGLLQALQERLNKTEAYGPFKSF